MAAAAAASSGAREATPPWAQRPGAWLCGGQQGGPTISVEARVLTVGGHTFSAQAD
jgi:hypothetical protein